MKHVNVNVIVQCELVHVFKKNSKYLKSVTDDLKIVSNEIINIKDSVSTNFTSTVSTNIHNKKVR